MGNTIILRKVLEELEKSEPNISYVRGMVETLVSLEPDSFALQNNGDLRPIPVPGKTVTHVASLGPLVDPSIPPPPPGMAKILDEANKNIG